MKRLLALVVVLVPLSFLVAGCGGSGGSSSKSTQVGPDKQKEMMEMMKKGQAMQKGGAPASK